MDDLRTNLKSSTSASHARLDARVDESGFFASQYGYQRYLHATCRARLVVEPLLDRSGAKHLYEAWPERRLGAHISEDMRDLGLDSGPEMQTPVAGSLGVAGMLGTLYVLEGSALGARIIGERVAQIGMTAAFGARHLSHQTSHPQSWRTFLRLLQDTPLSAGDEAACINHALLTFALFEREYGRPD